MLARAQRLGVLVAAGEGRFEVPSPALLAVAERVVARGVSLDGALAVFEQIERHCDAVSASFVKLFLDEVWQPFRSAPACRSSAGRRSSSRSTTCGRSRPRRCWPSSGSG